MWDLLLNNWGAVVALLVFVFGLLKGVGWVRFVVSVADYAFREAHAAGILKGLKGYQKAEPYLDAFFTAWEAKQGKQPGALTQGLAQFLAAHKAAKSNAVAPIAAKVNALTNPPSPSTSTSETPTSA